MRILVVEDEIKTGAYLQQGLSETGFTVALARNGLDGQHLAATEPFDVIILDVMLPDVDGWRVVQSLRTSNVTTPILFLSARDSVKDRVKGLELGGDDYLVKPFSFAELLARVRSLLRRGAVQSGEDVLVVAAAIEQVLLRYANDTDQLQAALIHTVPLPQGASYQVVDQQGRILYTAPETGLEPLSRRLAPVEEITADKLSSWDDGNRSYRGASVIANSETRDLVISIAMEMSFHDEFMNELRRTLWAVTLGAGLLTLAVVWVALRQGLAPVRRLSVNIRGIPSDRLQSRLDPATVPKELSELVDSFNQMLGQLDDSYSRLSHFSSDIAHELRTPLTNVITQTQVALVSARSAEAYRELLHSNLEEMERLARMVSDMLWLAQADRGLLTPAFEWLDLADEVHSLLDYFEVLAEEQNVGLALQSSTQRMRGDRSMVRRALANLLSNALRHAPQSGCVTVRLARDQQQISLSVENTGADIPPEHLARVFDRFYQVDPSRSRHGEGSGLGLAIVRSIVSLHDGAVDARSDNGLTKFTVTFPVSKDGVEEMRQPGTSAPA